MESKNKVALTFIILIFLIGGLYVFSNWFSKATGFLVEDETENELAKCLSKNGAKLYVSPSCPNCKKQEALLGQNAFDFLNKIDCSSNPIQCSGLKMVPAWLVNQTMYYGVKTALELKGLSGCE